MFKRHKAKQFATDPVPESGTMGMHRSPSFLGQSLLILLQNIFFLANNLL